MKVWRLFRVLALLLSVSFLLAACGSGGEGSGNTGGGGGGPSSQGSLSSPVIIPAGTSATGTVTAGADSYYKFTGLTGGAAYSVTFSGITNPITPSIYVPNSTANTQSCFASMTYITGTGSCIVLASSDGTILFHVNDFSTLSSSYTMSAALAVDAGQGTPTSPIAFALGSTANGTLTSGVSTSTYDYGNSGYYRLTGLTANHRYTITLSTSAGVAFMRAYQGNYSLLAINAGGGTQNTLTAAGTSLLLQVRAYDTASFSITATDNGAATIYTQQGAKGSEVVLKLETPDVAPSGPANGTVDTTKSYYTIKRLVPGQAYDVYLDTQYSGFTDDVNLYVYTDSSYTQLACSALYTSYKPWIINSQHCQATPNAAGQLWIVADGSPAQTNLGSLYNIGAKRIAPVQGTSAAPIVVNGGTGLPFYGSWNSAGISYYKITGLTPNSAVMVTRLSDHVWAPPYGNLSVYSGTGYGSTPCQTKNYGYSSARYFGSCTGTTDSSGNLYITLNSAANAAIIPEGGTAYINVQAVPVNHGTSTSPVAENMSSVTSFTGQVAGGGSAYSYYAITGLAASAPYYIDPDFGPDGQYTLMRVLNSLTSGDISLSSSVCSSAGFSGCTATTDSSGRLWVEINGIYTDHGSNFTVEALPVPVNEGTSAAPLDITGRLPYRGTVSASSASYYTLTGLTAGSEYAFSAYNSSVDGTFAVYNDVALTSRVCTPLWSNYRSISCRGTPTGSVVYIVTSSTVSAAGYYSLNVAQVPAYEGTPAAPIAYSAGTLAGKVNVGASYYKATMSPNTSYTISLGSVIGDPDLHVFNSAAMTGAEACGSMKGVNQVETCTATSDSNGNLWITVDGEMSKAGGTYNLTVN